MEEYKGYVENIKFRNDSNGYTVFFLNTGAERITCVGNIPAVDPGENVRVTGELSVHPVYGEQLSLKSCESMISDDTQSILRYLSSGAIKGIGEKLAERIIGFFGDQTADILEKQPERLAEVKGISEKRARDIGVQYKEKKDTREAFIFLSGYGMSGNMSIVVYNRYGDEIYRIMRDNPYRLAEDIKGIGFKKADEIAKAAGIEADSEYRIASGLLYVAQEAVAEGNVYVLLDDLLAHTSELLGIDESLIMEGVENLAADRKLIIRTDEDENVHVYAAELYYTEVKCAALLRDLKYTAFGSGITDDRTVDLKLAMLEREMDIRFDEMQKEAVRAAVSEGIVIVTGGPGTGKTTIIKAMIRYFNDEGLDILLAAPTGRAAKRMTEATGYESKTIHRMLELTSNPEDPAIRARFERNEENPLEADVIIIDEMSMVDLFLFRALLTAISPGTRLIMVGDMDQLPSVGPGQVLRDIIGSEAFKVVMLNVIFRQTGDSDIVNCAHDIRMGKYPKLDNKSTDFFFMPRGSINDIYSRTVQLITGSNESTFLEYVGATPFDIQVLTPLRKGPMGVEGLNAVIQAKVNPPSPDKAEIEYGSTLFRTGDKVMQIKNNYQTEWSILGQYGIPVANGTGVFNGDLGRIINIDESDRMVTVEYDDARVVEYDYPKLEELELAYAVTIHKSQGSEYPAVIIPVLSGPPQLLNRNLLYTAITRAKKCVVLIGSEKVIKDMVDNESVNLRNTGLKKRIKEVMGIVE